MKMPERCHIPIRVNNASISESDYAANIEVQTIMRSNSKDSTNLIKKAKIKDGMTLAIEKLDEEFNSRKNSYQDSFYQEVCPDETIELKTQTSSSPLKNSIANILIESPIKTPPKIMISTIQNESNEDLSNTNNTSSLKLKSSSKILKPSPINSRQNSITKSAYSLASKSEANIPNLNDEQMKTESVASLVQKFNLLSEQAKESSRVTSPKDKVNTSPRQYLKQKSTVTITNKESLKFSEYDERKIATPLEKLMDIETKTRKLSTSKPPTPKLNISPIINDKPKLSESLKIDRKQSNPRETPKTLSTTETLTNITQELHTESIRSPKNTETNVNQLGTDVIIKTIRKLSSPFKAQYQKKFDTTSQINKIETLSNENETQATSYVSIGRPNQYVPKLINSKGFEPNLAVTDTTGQAYKFGLEIQNMIDLIKPLIDEKLGRKTKEIKSLNYAYAMPFVTSIDNFGPGCSHFVKALVDNEEYIHIRVYIDLICLKPAVSILPNKHPNDSIELFL